MTDSTDPRLIFLELNEVNFDYLRGYADKGLLPTFKKLLDSHGYALTESESEYVNLEPWIQWVTAHTGKTYAEHGVFRLGDIVHHDIPQIWEQLEQRGMRVGAISPMNAKNRLREPAFFVPDPWTRTQLHAGGTLTSLYDAIAQAVSDNASARISISSLLKLVRGFVVYAAPANWPIYFGMVVQALRRPWRKAMFLDLLLADVFMRETSRTRPHFATLFVNAAAHIQHHYLFSSSMYAGSSRNPEWYVDTDHDPVLEVYQLYDRIISRVIARFPASRLMLGTGLHQNPHASITFYWRLRDHAAFLKEIGLEFAEVSPRMSRDFLVSFVSAEAAAHGAALLGDVTSVEGVPLFTIDNRGRELFVELTYSSDVAVNAGFEVRGNRFNDLRGKVAFVALKNGEHDGIGYLVDTGQRFDPTHAPVPLTSVSELVFNAVTQPLAASR
jgi:hypothetical protein